MSSPLALSRQNQLFYRLAPSIVALLLATTSFADAAFSLKIKNDPLVGGNSTYGTFTLVSGSVTDTVSTQGLIFDPLFVSTAVGRVTILPGTTTFRVPFSVRGVDSPASYYFTVGNKITNGNYYGFALMGFSVLPADVAAVGFNKSSLSPFEKTKGVVILNGEAGPSGRTVTLTSNDPVISVPATVTVPPFARRVEFDVTNTSNVLVPGSATVTAQIGTGPSASKSIGYSDFRQVSIVPSATQIVGGNPLGFIVTTTAALPALTALGFDWTGTATGSFPTLVQFPAGRKTVGFSVVPDGVDTPATLTVTGANSSAPYPSATVQVLPATLTGVTMNSTYGGVKGTGSVTLNGFAGPSGVDILLDAAAIHASFPAFVTIPPNQRSATFTYTTTGTDADEVINLMAYQGATTVTSTGTVRRAGAGSLVPSVTSTGTGRVTFTVRLNGSAGATGTTFTLSSSSAALSVPASVQVLQGKASATFVGTATSTGVPTNVTITATGPSGVGSVSTTVTVN